MNALSVKQLKKTYANGLVALKGIDLEVKAGDFFALLGQNGAGKSTTIGIISSLVKKTAGTIHVFGHDMDVEMAKAKSLIAVVPQEINFNSFEKISDVLINQAGYYGVPKKIAILRMEHYLAKMNLLDMRHQAVMRLSGGMKRRLMIARALINQPRLLILDEPTAGVDVELRHLLWEFLVELNEQGTTIILTTHYLEEAERLCKNVAIIDRGEIIEYANMKSLINRISSQIVVFSLEKPLEQSLELENYPYHLVDETTLEIEVKQDQSLNDLFQLLNKNHIKVRSMHNKTNRLEQLFMHLVSKNKT